MLDILLSSEGLTSLVTLTLLELVLGIDNIIFIAILAAKLPEKDQTKARHLGLTGALFSRLILLGCISFIMKLDTPVLSLMDITLTGKDLILLVGGLFLIYKATKEIHEKLESEPHDSHEKKKLQAKTLFNVVVQITLLDIVFSIDSVITAVGLTPHISIMVIANVIALGVMVLASKSISEFVNKHPSIKVLALSFLLMIGMVLIGEGVSFHIPKGYIYFAMGFSMFVELINIKSKSRRKPIS